MNINDIMIENLQFIISNYIKNYDFTDFRNNIMECKLNSERTAVFVLDNKHIIIFNMNDNLSINILGKNKYENLTIFLIIDLNIEKGFITTSKKPKKNLEYIIQNLKTEFNLDIILFNLINLKINPLNHYLMNGKKIILKKK